MENILGVIKDFVLLYLLLTVIFQMLGDSDMNKYIRFFAGIIFMLLILSPIKQIILDGDLSREIYRSSIYNEFKQQVQFETMIKDYDINYKNGSEQILIDAFEQTIRELGYEVWQYESKQDVNGKMEYVKLYVGKIGSRKDSVSTFQENAMCAKECKDMILREWEPEFEIRVYGKDE